MRAFTSITRRAVKNRLRDRQSRNGVTLVELLIVIAIISVIAAISLPVTKDLVQQNRISESVRTVRSFVEAARSQAMNTGREHGVSFVREGAGDGFLAGAVTTLELVAGAPSYRGDVEGARCWLIHEQTIGPNAFTGPGLNVSGNAAPLPTRTDVPNAAIFDPAQCPSLLRTLRVYKAGSQSVVSMETKDLLVFDGFTFPIIAFSECDVADLNLINMSGDPADWVKVYFDPRSATGELASSGNAVLELSVDDVPKLPPADFRRCTFEINRLRLRGGSTKLDLVNGAAIDLYFSGAGPGGTEFSPLSIWNPDPANLAGSPAMLPVVVVFDGSGNVSRVLFGVFDPLTSQIALQSVVPKTTMHFLVGRSDQVRPDLLNNPPAIDPSAQDEISNITDLDSRWLSINPLNGRITTSVISGQGGVPTSVLNAVSEARRAANSALETN